MTINGWSKLKFVRAAFGLAFVAALATSATAEEAAPQSSGDAKTSNAPAHAPDSVPAGNDSAPPPDRANGEDIDTRISVQPHGPSAGKPSRVGGGPNPIVPLKLVNPHRRTFSPSRAANRLPANASGIPSPQGRNLQQSPGERFEYRGFGQRPSIGGSAGIGSAGLGLVKPGGTIGHRPLVQSTGISPAGVGAKTVIRGGIGGTSLNHHALGSGIAGIGGPARTTTGINGTSIRETH